MLITMSDVSKIYKVSKNKKIEALKGVNLTIEKGDSVGYIGTNGAGKSTTIKLLTGILKPTKGYIQVKNIVPYKSRKKLALSIGVVFGQRTQLIWDLPPIDSFELHSKMYKIPKSIYLKKLEELVEEFKIGKFINQPVRKLSLGQRIQCDIILSLLHSPDILFLDEPTIGLDIFNKELIRNFLFKLNNKNSTTIILTSHDLQDVEAICKRIVIMREGNKIYDNKINKLHEMYDNYTKIKISYKNLFSLQEMHKYSQYIHSQEKNSIEFSIPKNSSCLKEIFQFLALQQENISDISMNSNSLEEIIKKISR